MTETILLFPTTTTRSWRKVSNQEKETWFDLYLKHSNQNGESHDWLGYEELHLEPSVEFFYKDILMPVVKSYLDSLHVNRNNISVHVTKSFFNVTDKSGINKHNHEENHISFVYYPHIAEGKERDLMLFQNARKHSNEPYHAFFADNVTEWDPFNSRVMRMEVKEGYLYVFPSDMDHDLDNVEGDANSCIKGFTDKKALYDTRFCVAGDMLITRNHSNSYQRTLSPPEKWKNFS